MKITKRDTKGRIDKGSNVTHNKSKEPIYDCWIAMKARCTKSYHPNYYQYGGRGITVCKKWLYSFEEFYKDMGEKPSSKYTLDRIDVNGNYSKKNCRWVTIQEQQKNRRNNNEIVGVVYEPLRKKWRVDISFNKKKHFLGRFSIKQDAINARLKGEKELWH